MQTITVKYFPVTNTKPARYQAVTSSGLKGPIVSGDRLGGSSREDNMLRAARARARALGWTGEWVGGDIGGTSKMIFVCCDPENFDRFTV